MGNYGNTLDRWYRRAAVVVWPRDRAFAARAEAGSQWALHELSDRIATGDLDGARAAAESLAPFWNRIGAQAGLMGTALHVAADLRVAGTAAMLLQPFRVETLAAEHADELAEASGEYGEEWTRGVIEGWFGPEHYFGTDRHEWVERLPDLCGALHAAGSPQVARLLAAKAWGWTSRPAADLDNHRAGRDPSATAGDAEPTAGPAAGGSRRQVARGDRVGTARLRGQRAGFPDAGVALGGQAACGHAAGSRARRDRARLRGAARRDHRAAATRRRRLVDPMDRVRVRSVRHAGDVSRFPIAADLRVAAGDRRAAPRAQPDRRSWATGAAPDPAAAAGPIPSC